MTACLEDLRSMVLLNILVVDEDPALIARLGRALQECGHVHAARSGADALEVARQCAPALILLAAELPDMSGFDVCAALKASEDLAQTPFIFLTTSDSAEQEVRALELGAADCVAKPPREHLLLARVQLQLRMRALATALHETRAVDALTGLASREHFDSELRAECARASRAGSGLAVLVIALDAPRLHLSERQPPVDEPALRSLAAVMRGTLQRTSDVLGRFGAAEFAAILPNTDGTGAMLVAHNIIAAVDAQSVRPFRSPSAGHLTASVGVTVYDAQRGKRARTSLGRTAAYPVTPVASDLLAAAGRAVVSAKHAGGHCVCFVAVEGVAKPATAQIHTAAILDGE